MKPLFKKTAMMFVIFLTLFSSAIGVAPAYAATLTVTNTNDSGVGSLRDMLVSAAPGDTINFDSSLAGATIHLATTINISQDVTIDGSALTVPITISGDSDSDGAGDVQILSISSGTTVVLNSLIFANGQATNNTSGAVESAGTLTINNSIFAHNYAENGGGAIFSYGPTITITNSTFTHNISAYGGGALQAINTTNVSNSTFSYNSSSNSLGGGAIYSAGTITVTNSSFSHNTSTTHAGGLEVINGTATVSGSTFDHNSAAGGASIAIETGAATVSNSTFASNSTSGIAGGIYNNGTLNLTNSTFSDNTAVVGVDIANFNLLNFSNNILANAIGATNCYNTGTVATNVNNLIEANHPSCGTELLNSDPQLGTLADNGGPSTSAGQATQTMAPLPGSPAIDAGDNAACAAAPVSNLDQRGVTRPVGGTCDMGAVEYVTTYLVTTAADTNDGTCDADCSLREAVIAANADANGDTILFNGNYTITLGASLPSATDDLTMDGAEHTIILDGANTYQIMDAQAGLHLKNLTIQHASGSNGGAILTRSPSTIANVTFYNNAASSNGGAVYNYQSTLTVTNSTFTGNSAAAGGGGAIKNDTGTLIVSNSTFSGNSADTGGAIVALFSASSVTTSIYNSSFSGNSATTQAGGIYSNGTFNTANNIIANSSGADCVNDGTLGINLNNIVEDGSCSAALSGGPNLGTLANNGGATQTLALLAHSIAINAGNDAICLLAPVNSLDQRGTTRPNGPQCDIGAVEYADTTAPNVTAFTVPSPSTSLTIPINNLTASDDVAVTGYKVTASATPPLATDTGWTSSFPSSYTVGSDGSYTLYPWAKDIIGHVSAVYNAPASVTVDTTAPTVISITLVNPSPTAGVSLQFLATFSEAVSSVDAADFSLTATVTGASISSVSGSGTTRTVTINSGSGDGTLRLDIPNTASISDPAGNALSGLPYTSGASYTINKTLAFTSTNAQDGWILETSETSNTGGTFNSNATTFNLGDDATKKQYRGILSFNTSNIPDTATITSVTLKLKQSAIVGGGNPVSLFKGFMVDIKKGFFGTTALQASDFSAAASKSYGPFKPAPVSSWYSITLTSGKAYINTLATNSGLTQIRLRFKLDDNGNAVANYLRLFSGNAPAASRPQLVITYSVP